MTEFKLIHLFAVLCAWCALAPLCIGQQQTRNHGVMDSSELKNRRLNLRNSGLNALLDAKLIPAFLDFGSKPISTPSIIEATLANVILDETIEIITVFSSHESFYWSNFTTNSLPPSETSRFNVTFVPYKIGLSEGTITISTSHGFLKYQTFGSGYVSESSLIPTTSLEMVKDSRVSINLQVFNPNTYLIEVSDPTLCLLRKKSNEANSWYSMTEDIYSDEQPVTGQITSLARFLQPHQNTMISKVDLLGPGCLERSTTTFSWKKILQTTNSKYQVFYPLKSKCQNIINNTTSFTMTVHLQPDCSSDSKLVPKNNILHFGTLSTSHGSVTREFALLNRYSFPLVVTRVEIDTYQPAFSIQLTDHVLSARSSVPQTVAWITLSAEKMNSSHLLSGFITAYTRDKSIFCTIPYHAKVVRGLVTWRRVVWPRWLPGWSNYSAVYFDYFLINGVDQPLTIAQVNLPTSLKSLFRVENYTSMTTTDLRPGHELLLFRLSQRVFWPAQLHGSAEVITNVSRLKIGLHLFSGHLDLRLEETESHVSSGGLHDLGSVPVGQRRTATLVVHNANPVLIRVHHLLIATVASEEEAWRLLHHHSTLPAYAGCSKTCQLSAPNQTCHLCLSSLGPGDAYRLNLTWGGSKLPTRIRGFIILQSTYHQIVQPFRYYMTVGELTLRPNPIQVDRLFPGKLVRKNLVLQNDFPYPVRLDSLTLEAASLVWGTDYRLTSSTIRLVTDPNFLDWLNESADFTPGQSFSAGSVVFDPTRDCVDVFQAEWASFSGVPSVDDDQQLDIMKPLCYTGFSLETQGGREWLLGMVYPNTRLGVGDVVKRLETTSLIYSRLQSAWLLSYPASWDVGHHRLSPVSARVRMTLQNGSDDDDKVSFQGHVSALLVWPSLLGAQTSAIGAVMRCYDEDDISWMQDKEEMKSFDGRPLMESRRIRLPNTIQTNVSRCMLTLSNPSDRPVLVQAYLLDAVRAAVVNDDALADEGDVDDRLLTGFLLNLIRTGPLKEAAICKQLTSTDVGRFSVSLASSSTSRHLLSTFNLSADSLVSSPFPVFVLPASGGQSRLQLAFSPSPALGQQSVDPQKMYTPAHNLLLLHNNLTGVEPVWLTSRVVEASLFVGLLRSQHAAQRQFEATPVVMGGADDDVLTSPDRLEGGSVVQEKHDDVGYSWVGSERNAFPNLASKLFKVIWRSGGDSKSEAGWRLLDDNENVLKTPDVTRVGLSFDFSEQSLRPFCTNVGDSHLLYKLSDSSAGLNDLVFQAVGLRGQMLATTSIRRRLCLVNTGLVPISVYGLALLTSDEAVVGVGQCSVAGFLVRPCVLPPAGAASLLSAEELQTSTPLTIPVDGHLSVELRYSPDFTHIRTSVRFRMFALPHNSLAAPPDIFTERNGSMSAGYLLKDVVLMAEFPADFLHECLKVLPRPWIETIMWYLIVLLFCFHLPGVLFFAWKDAGHVLRVHRELRRIVDKLPSNRVPDATRIFNLRLVAGSISANQLAEASGTDMTTSVASPCVSCRQPVNCDHSGTAASATTVPMAPGGSASQFWRWYCLLKWAAVGCLWPVYLLCCLAGRLFCATGTARQPASPVARRKKDQAVVVVVGGGATAAAVTVARNASGSFQSDTADSIGQSGNKLPTPVGTGNCVASTGILDDRKANSRSSRCQTGLRSQEVERLAGACKKKAATKGSSCGLKKRPAGVQISPSLVAQIICSQAPPRDVDSSSCSSGGGGGRTGTDFGGIETALASSSGTVGPLLEDAMPMTEARTAAAVRATMRLAEQAGGQARRKVVKQFQQQQQHKYLRRQQLNLSSSSGAECGALRQQAKACEPATAELRQRLPGEQAPDRKSDTSPCPQGKAKDGIEHLPDGLDSRAVPAQPVGTSTSSSYFRHYCDPPRSSTWDGDGEDSDLTSPWDTLSFATIRSVCSGSPTEGAMDRLCQETKAFEDGLLHELSALPDNAIGLPLERNRLIRAQLNIDRPFQYPNANASGPNDRRYSETRGQTDCGEPPPVETYHQLSVRGESLAVSGGGPVGKPPPMGLPPTWSLSMAPGAELSRTTACLEGAPTASTAEPGSRVFFFYELPRITHEKHLSMLEHEQESRGALPNSSYCCSYDLSRFSSVTIYPWLSNNSLDDDLGDEVVGGGRGTLAAGEQEQFCYHQRQWLPIHSIPMEDLLQNLGLEKTDPVLAFDAEFSYLTSR